MRGGCRHCSGGSVGGAAASGQRRRPSELPGIQLILLVHIEWAKDRCRRRGRRRGTTRRILCTNTISGGGGASAAVVVAQLSVRMIDLTIARLEASAPRAIQAKLTGAQPPAGFCCFWGPRESRKFISVRSSSSSLSGPLSWIFPWEFHRFIWAMRASNEPDPKDHQGDQRDRQTDD